MASVNGDGVGLAAWFQRNGLPLALVMLTAIVTVIRLESGQQAIASEISHLSKAVDKLSSKLDGQTIDINDLSRRVSVLEDKHYRESK